MLIENPDALKSWLTTILEPKCDADPNALAKYVIALVKKDKPQPDLKETCIDQLDVFLQQETKPFVELLFRTLETKSYLKKNESQPIPPAQPQTSAHPSAHQSPVLLSSPLQPPHMGLPHDPVASSSSNVIVGGGSSNMGGGSMGAVAPSALSGSTSGSGLRDAVAKDRDSRGRLSRPENLQDTDEREKRSLRKPSPVNRSRSRSRSRSSRSRSRNRSRSRSRDRDERRPIRRYNEEVKRDRRGPLPRRYDRYNDYSRHDRMRDRDRSRERESDRGMKERGDRTRSRSRTPRSRTRSRSRSPRDRVDRQRPVGDVRDANHKTQSPNKLEHGDKDYRYSSTTPVVPSAVVAVTNQQPPVIVPPSAVAVSAALPPVPGTVGAESQAMFAAFPRGGKSSRRCRDFDEMGYCMRGELCPYDHGSDPVVVEDVNLPGMIGFPPPPPAGQGMRPSAPPVPIPPIMGHPPLPRPPLPPPPQPHPPGIKMPTDVARVRPDGTSYYSDPFLPEPYNPEAPSLDRPQRLRPSYWNPRPALPRGIGMRPVPVFQQQMTRELISVPTIDNPTQQGSCWKNQGNWDRRSGKGFGDLVIFDASKGRMVVAPQKRPYDSGPRDGGDMRGLRDPNVMSMNLPPNMLHNNGSNANDNNNTSNMAGLHGMNNNNSGHLHSMGNNNSNNNNNVLSGAGDLMNKRRPFDFNRLGPRKNNSENATLELRKIPRGLNSITQLNNHFAKFGRIVNLQVCFEGNPEAALITFSSHAEANAAYRSTEAVLNNRFIKVFWHNKENNENAKQDSLMPVVTPSLTHTFGNRKLSVKDRLGVPVVTVVNAPSSPENNSANNNSPAIASPMTHATQTQQIPLPPGDDAELLKASVVLSPTGNLSKTVFNPAALKKNNMAPAPTKVQQVMAAHDAVKKKQVEKRKEFMKINSDIQKRKQELLEKYIQDQKALIERLEKKDMIPAEREKLLLTVKSIQECSFKKDQVPVAIPTREHPKTKTEAQKLLLDFEMDLYNKQHQGADTTELKKRVAELKQEARALGLLDSVRGGRGRGRGRGVRSLSFRGRGVRSSSASVDHRPRKLLVTGLDESERDEAMLHLAQFGEIEGIDHDEVSHFTVLTFRTRKEAEMFVQAMLRGPKFKERSLNVSWFKDHSPDPLAEGVDAEGDVLLVDDLENVELLLADDEEEEDSEARSWKR